MANRDIASPKTNEVVASGSKGLANRSDVLATTRGKWTKEVRSWPVKNKGLAKGSEGLGKRSEGWVAGLARAMSITVRG